MMEETAAAGCGLLFSLFWLALMVLMIVSLWKVFTKANQPGWAIFIPIYNIYVLMKIAGRPGWWLILFFIPIVNIIIAIIVYIDIAKNFGKGAGFAIGLLLLPMVFVPILAFGDAQYQGAAAQTPSVESGTAEE